jgi:Raf kinase inhibitor-like YbhB/YbcL family protein
MRAPLAVVCTLHSVACGAGLSSPSGPPGAHVASVTVTSKSFATNGRMPIDHTCDGKNVSPQLTWSAPPEGTKSIAVVVDDSDGSSGPFTHWLVYDLPPSVTSLAEGADPVAVGAKVGMNDRDGVRYDGPCPPRMQEHRIEFHVYALDVLVNLRDGAGRAELNAAMNAHVLGEGVLHGTFSR